MKPATTVASIFLGLVAFLHLIRAVLGVEITVGMSVVPMWMSWAAVVVTGGLSLLLWRENRR